MFRAVTLPSGKISVYLLILFFDKTVLIASWIATLSFCAAIVFKPLQPVVLHPIFVHALL